MANFWEQDEVIQPAQTMGKLPSSGNWWDQDEIVQPRSVPTHADMERGRLANANTPGGAALQKAIDATKAEWEGPKAYLKVAPEAVARTLSSAANGASFGLADEALAGLSAVAQHPIEAIKAISAPPQEKNLSSLIVGEEKNPFWKSYDESLGKIRGFNEETRRLSPEAATIAELSGSLLSGGAFGGAAKTAGKTGLAYLMELAKAGGKAGAISGGLTGFGNSEGDIKDRLVNAGLGAAVGGTVGGVVPVLGSAVSKAISPLTGLFGSAESLANKKIAQNLIRSGVDDAQAIPAQLQAMHPEARMVDLGKNMTGLGEAVANMPGAGMERLATALEGRAVNRPDRLVDEIGNVLNPNKNTLSSISEDITNTKQKLASPKYEEAFANSGPVDTTNVLNFIDSELGQAKGGIRTALERAKSLISNSDGSIDTSLAGLHQSKMALDDAIQAVGKDTSLGNVSRAKLMAVRDTLVNAMDEANPLYKEARGIYAGGAAAQDALDQGLRFNKFRPEEIADALKSMDQNSLDAFKAGTVRSLDDNKKNLSRLLTENKLQNQLRSVYGDDTDSFNKLLKNAQVERDMAKREANILANSATARRLSGQVDLNEGADTALAVANGNFMAPVMRLASRGIKGSLNREGVRNSIADLLVAPSQDLDGARLAKIAQLMKSNQSTSGKAGGRLGAMVSTLMNNGS